MFYLKKFFFARNNLLSEFIITSLSYSRNNGLLFLLAFNSLNSSLEKCSFKRGTSLQSNRLCKLFTIHFLVIFYFTLIQIFHLIMSHLVDFSKSSLKRSKLNISSTIIKVTSVILCVLNFMFLILILPNCSFFLVFQ